MLESSVYAFACLMTVGELPKQKITSKDYIKEQLEPKGLPEKTSSVLENLKDMQEELSKEQVFVLFSECQDIFQFVNRFFEEEVLNKLPA